MARSRFLHITAKGKMNREESLEALLAAGKRGGFVWIDYVDPTREDLERLIEPLGIHPLSIEDCLDDDPVPKVDDLSGNTFVLFNRYRSSEEGVQITEVDLFLGAGFLITVNQSAADVAGFYEKLDELVQLEMDQVRKGPDFLMHVILDYIVDRKYEAIEHIEDRLDSAEEAILRDARTFRPEELMGLRRSLLALRKSLFHEREILVKLCRRDSPFVTDKAVYHYRDIYDHLAKFFEVTEIHREMITSLMEIYLSMINTDMARVSHRTNAAVRRLTLITTIFMPLTLLAGIGGMSEWTMMTGREHWPVAYALFLLALGGIGFGSYLFLRWIEGRAERPV